jgi:hypothetical protein
MSVAKGDQQSAAGEAGGCLLAIAATAAIGGVAVWGMGSLDRNLSDVEIAEAAVTERAEILRAMQVPAQLYAYTLTNRMAVGVATEAATGKRVLGWLDLMDTADVTVGDACLQGTAYDIYGSEEATSPATLDVDGQNPDHISVTTTNGKTLNLEGAASGELKALTGDKESAAILKNHGCGQVNASITLDRMLLPGQYRPAW